MNARSFDQLGRVPVRYRVEAQLAKHVFQYPTRLRSYTALSVIRPPGTPANDFARAAQWAEARGAIEAGPEFGYRLSELGVLLAFMDRSNRSLLVRLRERRGPTWTDDFLRSHRTLLREAFTANLDLALAEDRAGAFRLATELAIGELLPEDHTRAVPAASDEDAMLLRMTLLMCTEPLPADVDVFALAGAVLAPAA